MLVEVSFAILNVTNHIAFDWFMPDGRQPSSVALGDLSLFVRDTPKSVLRPV